MNKLLFLLSIFCLFSCRKYEMKHAHENINTLNKDIIQLEPTLIGNDSVKMTGYLRIGKRNKIYAVIVDSLPFVNGDNSKLIGKEVSSLKGKFANEIAADFYQVNENVLYHSFFVDGATSNSGHNNLVYPIKSNSYLFEITGGRISYNLGGAVQDSDLKFNTISPMNITNTGANLRMTSLKLNNNLTVQQFGFYIGKNSPPSNTDKTLSIETPFGLGTLNSVESGLEANTNYFYRAFVNTSKGNYLGDIIKFKTLAVENTAIISTSKSIDSAKSTIHFSGVVSNINQTTIKKYGFVYDTIHVPSANQVVVYKSVNSFKDSITNYLGNKTYYIRAFIETAEGTIYADEVSVHTPIVLPKVTTNTISNSNLYATISSIGGGSIFQKGFCWTINQAPTIVDCVLVNYENIILGNYSNPIPSKLLPNTTYYFRAFVKNNTGVGYGNTISYTTPKNAPFLASDLVVSAIGSTSAILSNTVVINGGANITSQGFCYSTNPNPTISNAKQVQSPILQSGLISNDIVALIPNATYYVRAYSTNSYGTTYSNEISFTTLSGLPIVSALTSSTIDITAMNLLCAISSIGGASITASGLVWSTASPNPALSNSSTFSNNSAVVQIGALDQTISGLIPSTNYYISAYATNKYGTTYSNVVSVSTLSGLPDLSTNAVTLITASGFNANVTIISNKGFSIINSGFVWSTSPNPTTSLSTKTSNNATYQTGSFTNSITGLIPNTTYYLRSYASNQWGTSYGEELVVKTNDGLPVVVTVNASSITSNYFNITYSISSTGGYPIVSQGFIWSTQNNPNISLDTKTNYGNSPQTGSKTGSSAQVNASTAYYVKAYATNSNGTVYGNEITVNTLSGLITLSTNSVTLQSSSTVLASANIVSNGGTVINNAGFVWDTNPNPTISLSTNINYSSTYQSGVFNGTITNLLANTTYYVRPYATNQFGTVYGVEKMITTSKGVPVVQTDVPINAAKNTISVTGSILSNSGASILTKGFCYSTIPNNQNAPKVFDASNFTAINTIIPNLLPGVKYYVKAFASNSIGIGFGNEIQIQMPSALSTVINQITIVKNGFQINSTVSVEPNIESKLTKRGLLYDTVQNLNFKTSNLLASNTSSGVLNDTIKQYLTNKTYYVKSFVINNADTTYNLVSVFKTFIPIVTTRAISYWGVTGGVVSDSGSTKIIERGIVYSTQPNPTIDNAITIIGSDSLNYTNVLKNIKLDSIYYVKAYCKNNLGISYGNELIDTIKIKKIEFSNFKGSLLKFQINNIGNIYMLHQYWNTSSNQINFISKHNVNGDLILNGPESFSVTDINIDQNGVLNQIKLNFDKQPVIMSVSDTDLNPTGIALNLKNRYFPNSINAYSYSGVKYYIDSIDYFVVSNGSITTKDDIQVSYPWLQYSKIIKSLNHNFIVTGYSNSGAIRTLDSKGNELNYYRNIGNSFGQHSNYIAGVTTDKNDNIFITDAGNKKIIKFNSILEPLKEWSGFFENVNQIQVDSTGKIYVYDSYSYLIVISTKYD